MDDTICFSKYCGLYRDGDDEVELSIFRSGDGNDGWTMEVVNDAGTTISWDVAFPSEEAAYREFMRTLQEEGMDAFAEVVRLSNSVH